MTFVQSKAANNTTAATSISVTLDAAPTPGNLLVAVVTTNNLPGTVTHPWGAAPDHSNGGTVATTIYSKTAVVSESATVTYAGTNSRNFTLLVMEFSPSTPGNTWALDQTATGSGASSSTLAIGPTAALAGTDDVVVGGVASNATIGTNTPTLSGMTVLGGLSSAGRGFSGYALPGSASAFSTTGTITGTPLSLVGALATYKQTAPAGGGQNSGFLALL